MSKHLLFVVVFFLAGCANISPMTDTEPPPTDISISTSTQTPVSTSAPRSEVTVGVVQVDVLNIREGPGTSYPTVGSLNKGEKFYILGDVTNSTNNKWLLIGSSSKTLGWVIGDQSHVTLQTELVDFNTYLAWQKNVDSAKSVLLQLTATP
jgi:uncharacterized protein YgiM (DUF1202 family)